MPRYTDNIFRYNKRHIKSKKVTPILIFSVFVIVFIITLFPHFFRNTYEVTITNKRVITHKNTKEYLFYAVTKNGQVRVFRNKNSLIEMKYISTDLYYAMEVNRKYQITAYGLNMPIISEYQNIVKVKGLPIELIPYQLESP